MYKHKWPHITAETKKAILKQLQKEEISIYNRSGVFETFEDEFLKFHNSKYALLFSSGTATLHAAMVACNFQPGDEVICPAYTFYATITPMFQTGATPILCDADKDGNIDPDKIESLITDKTKAIMVTHMWGIPCKMDKIKEICKKHDLRLIEDCSHAHGAKYKGQYLGTFGDIGVFSLQGQKIITGGEGGIMITNNKELYDRALLFGHYNKRCRQEISEDSKYYPYAVTGFGLKLRAHPLAIAMAHEQFSHLTEWHKNKNENAQYLTKLLSDVNHVTTPIFSEDQEPSWYAYVMQIDVSKLTIDIHEFCDELINRGIADADVPGSTCPVNLLTLFQKPEVLFPQYKDKIAYKEGDFPVAEKFFEQALKLPIDIERSKSYDTVLENYAEIIEKVIKKYTS